MFHDFNAFLNCVEYLYWTLTKCDNLMLLIMLPIIYPLIIQFPQIAEALGRRNPNVTNETFEFGKNRTEYRQMLEKVRKNYHYHYRNRTEYRRMLKKVRKKRNPFQILKN